MRKAAAPHPFLPSFCTICRRSASIGRGGKRQPYTYYCQECSEMPSTSKPLDEWEKNALLAMDDAAGEYVGESGSTDIATYTTEGRLLLWRHVMLAWQASMTEQANGVGAPF